MTGAKHTRAGGKVCVGARRGTLTTRFVAARLLGPCLAQLCGCGADPVPGMHHTYGATDSTGSSTGTPGMDTSTGTETGMTDAAGTQGEGTQSGSTGEVEGTGGVEGTGTGTDTSATQTETGGESSSGSPAPVCGDGEKEGDEECDDGNVVEADGCLNNCTREWLVFVTSDFVNADFGGVIGADYECRHRATKLFLPNGERYKAWISTSEVQPVDRLYHTRGRHGGPRGPSQEIARY